jgi:phosphomannomutase
MRAKPAPPLPRRRRGGQWTLAPDVFDIGMAWDRGNVLGRDRIWGLLPGFEVTASHNPINYNGMKIVKSASQPLDDAADFQVIKAMAGAQDWVSPARLGETRDVAGCRA